MGPCLCPFFCFPCPLPLSPLRWTFAPGFWRLYLALPTATLALPRLCLCSDHVCQAERVGAGARHEERAACEVSGEEGARLLQADRAVRSSDTRYVMAPISVSVSVSTSVFAPSSLVSTSALSVSVPIPISISVCVSISPSGAVRGPASSHRQAAERVRGPLRAARLAQGHGHRSPATYCSNHAGSTSP